MINADALSKLGSNGLCVVFSIALSKVSTNAGSNVTQQKTPITTPFAITIPISRPSEKVIKQSAINPATVVMELPITDLKVALMACAIALSLSPSNRFLFSS